MLDPSLITFLSHFVIASYSLLLGFLMIYGLHRYWIVFLYWRHHKSKLKKMSPADVVSSKVHLELPFPLPTVTIQLPLYNEMYVVERLIDSVCQIDYPKDKLEIQVLDDSTDDTVGLVACQVQEKRRLGHDIVHLRRGNRTGFKAGALAWGLERAKGEFIAIFDADFIPPPDFLTATLPSFKEEEVGMVQTRWGHINSNYSLLTRLQAIFLDGHFYLEHTARHKSGAFFNFNGTAGIWRKVAIETSGGWSARTLTEDVDLSYRAQLAGWKFVYLPDFVCPAELPVDIHAFRSQQRRWAKGAIQVSRYLLKDIWLAPIPFHTKVEATFHLTANAGYFLTVFALILLLPSLLLRQNVGWVSMEGIELGAFVLTSVSIAFFYVVSQREIHPDWRWRMRDIPALLSFGVGMCINNAIAVWEGLFGQQTDFQRTPKYNITTKRDPWKKKVYARKNPDQWFLQLLFSLYSCFTFIVAALHSHWGALPFIFLFVFGFSYITSLCFLHKPSTG